MKKTIAGLTAVSILLGLSMTAGTQELGDPKPCREDVKKFCKGIKAGGGRIWVCLKSHEDELTTPCREHMALQREKMKGFFKVCKDDRKKFCKGIPAGKGRIAACLKSHQDSLSEDCRAFFKKN